MIQKNWLKATLVAALAAAVAIPIAASAKPGRGAHGHRHFSMARVIERNAERLGIDEATVTKIQAVEEKRRAKAQELREASRRERAVMRELMAQAAPNEAAVLQQAEVLGQLRTNQQKEQLSAWLEIRSLLTPEQLDELKQVRQERRERFKERRRGMRRGASESPESVL